MEEYLKVLVCKGVIEILLGMLWGIKFNIFLDNEVEEEEGLFLIGCVVVGEFILV